MKLSKPAAQKKASLSTLLLSLALILFPLVSSGSFNNENNQSTAKTELVASFHISAKRIVPYKVYKKGFWNNTPDHSLPLEIIRRLKLHAIAVETLFAENSRQVHTIKKAITTIILSIAPRNIHPNITLSFRG